MKFSELIDKCIEKGTKVFINGVPEEDGGIIIKREEDFIRFEITNTAKKQEDTTKEILIIPIGQISSLSQGERKVGTLNGNAEKS